MKELLLKFISKESLIVYVLGLLLRFLRQKPNGKFAKFITSEEMRRTMNDVHNHYSAFCEAYDAEEAESKFAE